MSSTFILFTTVALGMSAVILALETMLVFKTNVSFGLKRLAVLAVFTIGALILYDKLSTSHRSYYDYLSEQIGLSFAGVVVTLSISGFCLLELTHFIHKQGGKAILSVQRFTYPLGFLLGLIGSYFILQTAAATLADILAGPISKTGAIQDVHLWTGTTAIMGGLVTVDGTVFRLPDFEWFRTLSVGQTVQLIYSLHTHYAFPPDTVALTPLGLFPIAVIGIDVVILTLWILRDKLSQQYKRVHDG